ncbi:MAG: radical SAM protein [Anaerolineales bacterium]
MENKNKSYARKKTLDVSALWKGKGPLLKHLDIELTERCNHNCIHCYINRPAGDADARTREMTTSQVKEVLQAAADLGCLTVCFTGGEVLLRRDFEELYRCARRLGLTVPIFTNGTLLTPRLADLFARIPPLKPIEITVYGMQPESYEAVTRVPGSFVAFQRGLRLLGERGVPFIVKCALLPPNKAEMEAFEAMAASLPAMDRPPSYVLSLDLRARRDSAERNRQVNALRLPPDDVVVVLARRGEAYLQETRAFCTRFTRPPGDTLFGCGAGKGSACVDAYGHIQMCMPLRHPETTDDLFEMGQGAGGRQGDPTPQRTNQPSNHLTNHLTNQLKTALTRFTHLRELRATNPDYLARCARCFLKGLCDQCPAKSWMEHGTLDTPVEYLCQVAHAKARYLGLLAKGENAWEIRDWQERIADFAAQKI